MRKPNYDEWGEREKAKAYGREYGYYGMIGGWIYKEGREPIIRNAREAGIVSIKRSLFNGEPICQGWNKFYRLYRREIEAYIMELQS